MGLKDGGLHVHAVDAVKTTALEEVTSGVTFPLHNDLDAPSFGVPLLSVGELARQGWTSRLDQAPPYLVAPSGETVPVLAHNNLYYLDVRPAGRAAMADMGAAEAASIPADVFEPYAGVAMLSRAAEAEGMSINSLGDKDPCARRVLAERFPDATVLADAQDGTWREVEFHPNRYRVMVAGIPCQPAAPTGVQRGWDDYRAAEIRRFVEMVGYHKPHHAVIENVYAFWIMMGQEFDKLMSKIGYVPVLSPGVSVVEYLRSTDHYSPVWRDRIHRSYEPKHLAEALPPLPTVEQADVHARPREILEFLRSRDDVPKTAFINGTFERLDEPRRAKEGDPRSPLVVATLHVLPSMPVDQLSKVE